MSLVGREMSAADFIRQIREAMRSDEFTPMAPTPKLYS